MTLMLDRSPCSVFSGNTRRMPPSSARHEDWAVNPRIRVITDINLEHAQVLGQQSGTMNGRPVPGYDRKLLRARLELARREALVAIIAPTRWLFRDLTPPRPQCALCITESVAAKQSFAQCRSSARRRAGWPLTRRGIARSVRRRIGALARRRSASDRNCRDERRAWCQARQRSAPSA